MHPEFLCFEWATYENRRPHPTGEYVVPQGSWENATLILRKSDKDIGEAWFKEEANSLFVDVFIDEVHGGSDDWWLRHLLAESLFGPEGLVMGYYHSRAERVYVRNFRTASRWSGTWAELHGEGGKFEPNAAHMDLSNNELQRTPSAPLS